MTESIFDPTGPETEHSGERYMGPSAGNDSHMPPDVVDGNVDEEEEALDTAPDEDAETEEIADAEREVEREQGGTESQSEL